MNITVSYPDGTLLEQQIPAGTTPEEILASLHHDPEYSILACRLNHRSLRLNQPVREEGTLEFLDLRDSSANMSYQTSLTLLYRKAVHDVCGSNAGVMIANSLSKGLFTRIHVPAVSDEMAAQIQQRMQELAAQNLPIEETEMDREALEVYIKQKGSQEERVLYNETPSLTSGILCRLDEEEGLFYAHLLPSTGYLKWFEVRRYRSGLLLRFPHQQKPDVIPPYEEQKLLYEAFAEETEWEKLMEVSFAGELNQRIQRNEIKNLIMLSEALHEKKIAEIAAAIKSSQKRIILIAGPSSSGKTSFAKRLCIQLQVIGLKPLYLGTDDYFIDRDVLPVDENGKQNFEDLEAVDTGLFTQQMNELLNGRKADLPEYDFLSGKKVFGRRITSISSDQPIVIEGIHGLNPALTEGIPEEEKFRIYISPLTQLNLDLHHRIPTTDARMLRRMVRDHRTRGTSAAGTIGKWQEVRRGEEKNIFPYCGMADVFFNSQCLYELAALKKYAQPLLQAIPQEDEAYPEAQRMLKFLEFFNCLEDDSVIANNSIVREFIGGSILVS